MTKARLLACPGCARHVRVTEPACVFCGRELPASFAEKPLLAPPPRMGRAGIAAYAGVLAASAAALVTSNCGGTFETASSDGGLLDGTTDGRSMADGSQSDSSSGYGDSTPGDDAIAVLYGLPVDAHFLEDATPPDANVTDAGSAPPDAAKPPEDAARPPADAAEPDAKKEDSGPMDAAHIDVVILPPYGIAPVYGASP